VRIKLDDDEWCGRAIGLSGVSLNGETIVRAVRDENDVVECARPGPLHEYVGWIRPGMELRTRTALAAVARSRGQSAPQDEKRERVLERLSGLPAATVEAEAEMETETTLRRRLAMMNEEIDRHRERVARLHGQVQALRENRETAVEATNALEDAVRELSECETEHAAAEQALKRARERQRQRHDVRDEQLTLEDRAANLAREARRYLVRELEAEFETTVEIVPGATTARTGMGFDADPVTAALAIARLGVIEAPIVLECNRFLSAGVAADWLDAPIIQL
jgi:chromosome segregation ATPase